MPKTMAITRREFIRNSALLTATAAQAQADEREKGGPGGNDERSNALKPVFPYGAVYFRKSNPPEQDWARDHQTAARLGMNTFRHWFMWSAIEVAPGKYDWSDYDRMMDLAAQNQIRVIIAEIDICAPEWAYRQYAHARYRASDGTVLGSEVSASSATGGFPGLCLDNPDVRAAAEQFLTALVEHYRHHPALLGYDLWNENTYPGGSPHAMYLLLRRHKKPIPRVAARPAWIACAARQSLVPLQLPNMGGRRAAPIVFRLSRKASIGCNFASTMRLIYSTGG